MNQGSNGGSRTKGALGLAVGLAVVIAVLGTGVTYFPTATNQGYRPEQPIPFSHKIHVQANKMDCKYCHVAPEYSRHSTIPSLNVCMNCHLVVRPDSPHVKKIQEAFRAGKPIEWVRVHELPDHVYFPHKRHIAAGLDCVECHGDVGNMDVVEQVSPLTMGWCLDCHRGVTTPESVKAWAPHGRDRKLPAGHFAATDCTTCHN